jgi:hypothetical protein
MVQRDKRNRRPRSRRTQNSRRRRHCMCKGCQAKAEAIVTLAELFGRLALRVDVVERRQGGAAA